MNKREERISKSLFDKTNHCLVHKGSTERAPDGYYERLIGVNPQLRARLRLADRAKLLADGSSRYDNAVCMAIILPALLKADEYSIRCAGEHFCSQSRNGVALMDNCGYLHTVRRFQNGIANISARSYHNIGLKAADNPLCLPC